MCFMGAGAILSAGTSILSSFMGNAAAKKQAWENNAARLAQQVVDETNRTEMLKYNTAVYKNNVDYRDAVLDHQESEWDRQVEFVDDARSNLEKNYFVKVGAALTRMFEEQVATMSQKQEIQEQSRSLSASSDVIIGERNIDGNTAEQLRAKIFKQEGDALTTLDWNETRKREQDRLEILGLKAEHDTKIGSLQLQTSAPLAPIQQPSPVSAVTPARMEKGPSNAAMWINIAGSALQGVAGYRQANGLTF